MDFREMLKKSELDRGVSRVVTYKALMAIFIILWESDVAQTLDNGLALTPPMGFNTWERYRCTIDCEHFPDSCINENLIMRTAHEMRNGGYLDAGYNYLVIDDCWMADKRTTRGDLQENRQRFPSGMSSLISYVHSLGLKFGIYENLGEVTCMGYPGTNKANVQRDANLFAKWKVDYVKLDGCFSDLKEKDKSYPEFGRALNQSGQPIVYSCSWPFYLVNVGMTPNYTAVVESCNLWRNFQDVQDSWNSVVDIVDYYGENQDSINKYHGPGHWHDADMLIIGNYGLSYAQSQAQMALWCVMGVPLFMSTDLTKVRPELKEILLNKVAIGINQDPMGKMGRRIFDKEGIQIWRKPILPELDTFYSYAVVILNTRTDGNPKLVSRTLEDLGLYHPKGYIVEDVFYPGIPQSFQASEAAWAEVPPSGVVFWKFTIAGARKDAEVTICAEQTRPPINLPDRTPYSIDMIGIIYIATIFAMFFIMMRSRIGTSRRSAIPVHNA